MKHPEKVPNIFIIGAEKSGTTSLYYYLKQHPQVYFPEIKEPGYFSYAGTSRASRATEIQGTDPNLMISSMTDYCALYEKAGENQLRGDASTVYLYDARHVIEQMKKIYGETLNEIRIMAILRNPIERAWSRYMMGIRDGEEHLEPLVAFDRKTIEHRLNSGYLPSCDYIGFGMYAEKLRVYQKNFPHTKVFLFDDLHRDPAAILNDIVEFLGIEPRNFNTSVRYNVSGLPQNGLRKLMSRIIFQSYKGKKGLKKILPYKLRILIRSWGSSVLLKPQEMPKEVRAFLTEMYEEEIGRLEYLLGRDLRGWLK